MGMRSKWNEEMKKRERWENMFPPEITVNKTNAELQAYHDNLLKGIEFQQ